MPNANTQWNILKTGSGVLLHFFILRFKMHTPCKSQRAKPTVVNTKITYWTLWYNNITLKFVEEDVQAGAFWELCSLFHSIGHGIAQGMLLKECLRKPSNNARWSASSFLTSNDSAIAQISQNIKKQVQCWSSSETRHLMANGKYLTRVFIWVAIKSNDNRHL